MILRSVSEDPVKMNESFLFSLPVLSLCRSRGKVSKDSYPADERIIDPKTWLADERIIDPKSRLAEERNIDPKTRSGGERLVHLPDRSLTRSIGWNKH